MWRKFTFHLPTDLKYIQFAEEFKDCVANQSPNIFLKEAVRDWAMKRIYYLFSDPGQDCLDALVVRFGAKDSEEPTEETTQHYPATHYAR